MPRKLKKLSAEDIYSVIICKDWEDLDKVKDAMKGKKSLNPLEIAKSKHVSWADRLWVLLNIMEEEQDGFSFPHEITEELETWHCKNARRLMKNVHNFSLPFVKGKPPVDMLDIYLDKADFKDSTGKAVYDRKLLRKITSLIEKWLKGDL